MEATLWKQWLESQKELNDITRKLNQQQEQWKALQFAQWPLYYPGVKLFQCMLRYSAGFASGGDLYEVVQSKDSQQCRILLASVNTYRLSSAAQQAWRDLSSHSFEDAPDVFLKKWLELVFQGAISSEKSKIIPEMSLFFASYQRSKGPRWQVFQTQGIHSFWGTPLLELEPMHPKLNSADFKWSPITQDWAKGSRLVLATQGLQKQLRQGTLFSHLNHLSEQDLKTIFYETLYQTRGAVEDRTQDSTFLIAESELPSLSLVST